MTNTVEDIIRLVDILETDTDLMRHVISKRLSLFMIELECPYDLEYNNSEKIKLFIETKMQTPKSSLLFNQIYDIINRLHAKAHACARCEFER